MNTGIIRRHLISGLSFTGLSGFCIKGINFAVTTLLVANLGIEGYGHYLLLLSIVEIGGCLPGLASGPVVQVEIGRAIARRRQDRSLRLLQEGLIWIGCLGLAAAAVLGGLYLAFDLPYLTCSLIVLLIVARGWKQISRTQLLGHGRFLNCSILETIEAVIRLALVLVFVCLQALTISQQIRLEIIATLCFTLLMLVAFSAQSEQCALPLRKIPGSRLIGIYRRWGWWSIIKGFIIKLTANGRLWILNALVGKEAVSLFGVARRLIQLVKAIIPLGTIVNALMSRYRTGTITDRETYRLIRKYSILFSVLAFLVGIPAWPLAWLVFFPSFDWQLVAICFVMSFGLILKGFSYPVSASLNAERRQRDILLASTIGLLAMATLNPPLVWCFDIWGTASEILVSSLCVFCVSLHFLRKHHVAWQTTTAANP